MPDVRLRNQPFDITFHPTTSTFFTSLLTGEVKAFKYDDESGECEAGWSVRPTKRTARALCCEGGGEGVWMGGKGGGLFRLDPQSGTVKTEYLPAHEAPVNRVFSVNDTLLASGDDEGVIKFWDHRQPESIRTYSHHFDYISDFTYFDDKRQLITTSGDGHLSVIDIRSSKASPLSMSEDQEDELLSILPIKGGTKVVVGSGLGILSIWNRKSGWGDCHPESVDALVALTDDVIATGSEDGMIRVMQVLPNKFLGVIATHEEYPIERMQLDRRRKWLGSVSHDECVKLTDVEGLLEDSDDEGEGADDQGDDDGDDGESGMEVEGVDSKEEDGEDEDEEEDGDDEEEEEEEDSDVDMDTDERPKKGKRGKGGMGDMGRKATKQEDVQGFFSGL